MWLEARDLEARELEPGPELDLRDQGLRPIPKLNMDV